jgi:hypothetical protein
LVAEHDSRRRDDWKRSMPSALHQSDIPCPKGRYLFKMERDSEEAQRHPDKGSIPRRVQAGGATPRRELPFSIDVKGGEIVTLMWRDEY